MRGRACLFTIGAEAGLVERAESLNSVVLVSTAAWIVVVVLTVLAVSFVVVVLFAMRVDLQLGAPNQALTSSKMRGSPAPDGVGLRVELGMGGRLVEFELDRVAAEGGAWVWGLWRIMASKVVGLEVRCSQRRLTESRDGTDTR